MTTASLTEALREALALFESSEAPLTTSEAAERLDIGRRSTYDRLARLVEQERLETKKVGANGRVWWRPTSTETRDRSSSAAASEQRPPFREAIERSTYPTYFTDREGRIEYVNSAFESTTGYSSEEVIGQTPQVLTAEIDGGKPYEKVWETVSTGDSWRGRRANITKSGTRYVVEEAVVPITDDSDEIEAFVGVHVGDIEWINDERERERQREQLAALSHVNAIVRDITDAMIKQSSREEIERTVCESLAAVSSYAFAWIGEVDGETQTVEIRTEAGVEGYLEGVTISVDPDDELSSGPAGMALRTGEVHTTNDAQSELRYESWSNHAEKYEYRSAAAIPIVHEETIYGVLKLYAERPGAFEGPERAILGHLGELVGHAISATERKRALISEEVVELEYHVPEFLDHVDIDATVGGQIDFESVVSTSDGEYLVYGQMTPDARALLEALSEQDPDWGSITVISEEEDAIRFQVAVADLSLRSEVASEGGSVRAGTLKRDGMYIRIHLPTTVDAGTISEVVFEEYPSARLLAKRQFPRPQDSMLRARRSLSEKLTERQRAVLEAAIHRGYFEWPRETSGEELAEALDIAPPTLSQHLRKAEKTVFESIVSPAFRRE